RLGVRRPLIGKIINLLREEAEHVPASALPDISPDPGDDPFCGCAEVGRADFIVTLNPKDCPPGRLRERGERRPALEARALGVDEDRVEVVEVPERAVSPGVGLLPQREELRPLEALLPGLDAEADRMRGHAASYTGSMRGGKWWSMRWRLLVGLVLFGLSAAGARAAELRLARDDRVLVLAPHPDDEALACGGLVQRALKMRLPVRIVFLTYGDSNEWS